MLKHNKSIKQVLLLLTLLGVLSVPYVFMNAWWKFLPSFMAICLFVYAYDVNNWKDRLGFSLEKISILRTFIAWIVALTATPFTLLLVMKYEGLTYVKDGLTFYRFMPFFQSLNEEIVFRAIFFSICFDRRWNSNSFNFAISGLFSLTHGLLYLSLENYMITFGVLISLFLFSYSMNCIFLACNSILPTFIIHFSWNFYRFPNQWIDRSGKLLSEAGSFVAIEGSLIVFVLSAFIFLSKHRIANTFLKSEIES
ncbi:MAG: CPBP family intramembrane glutamic endopeptidase [Oligoflexales bacterium]